MQATSKTSLLRIRTLAAAINLAIKTQTRKSLLKVVAKIRKIQIKIKTAQVAKMANRAQAPSNKTRTQILSRIRTRKNQTLNPIPNHPANQKNLIPSSSHQATRKKVRRNKNLRNPIHQAPNLKNLNRANSPDSLLKVHHPIKTIVETPTNQAPNRLIPNQLPSLNLQTLHHPVTMPKMPAAKLTSRAILKFLKKHVAAAHPGTPPPLVRIRQIQALPIRKKRISNTRKKSPIWCWTN